MPSLLFLILAATFFLIACIAYMRTLRQNPSDVMGASMLFDGPWFVGACLLSASTIFGFSLHWAWAIAITALTYVVGFFIKWLVLDRLIRNHRK